MADWWFEDKHSTRPTLVGFYLSRYCNVSTIRCAKCVVPMLDPADNQRPGRASIGVPTCGVRLSTTNPVRRTCNYLRGQRSLRC